MDTGDLRWGFNMAKCRKYHDIVQIGYNICYLKKNNITHTLPLTVVEECFCANLPFKTRYMLLSSFDWMSARASKLIYPDNWLELDKKASSNWCWDLLQEKWWWGTQWCPTGGGFCRDWSPVSKYLSVAI